MLVRALFCRRLARWTQDGLDASWDGGPGPIPNPPLREGSLSKAKREVPLGFEPRLQESKPWMITILLSGNPKIYIIGPIFSIKI